MQRRYVITGVLGNGSFGRVFKARLSSNNKSEKMLRKSLAIKRIPKYGNTLDREIEILKEISTIDHPGQKYLLTLQDIFFSCSVESEKFRVWTNLVFECCNCTLLDLIMNKSLESPFPLFSQISEGLSALHSVGITHRDLTANNVLIVRKEDKELFIRISDFGASKKVVESELNTTYITSLFYRAPELLMGAEYDQAVDVWSLGVLLFEMFCGDVPFAEKSSANQLRAIFSMLGKPTLGADVILKDEKAIESVKSLSEQAFSSPMSFCEMFPPKWKSLAELLDRMLTWPLHRLSAAAVTNFCKLLD